MKKKPKALKSSFTIPEASSPPSPALLLKAEAATTDDDGMFTSLGVEVLGRYASAWWRNVRDLELERQYPDLAGSFYDVRSDSDYARRWASEPVMQKALTLDEALVKAGLAQPAAKLVMAHQPIGPPVMVKFSIAKL